MSDIKVSVIIPVYNAEKYLEKALTSVCAQSLKETEIICVDDGSTDSSKAIIKDFAAGDERIRLIEQKNLFAGVARNNGLSQARGKYVIFWDSDDFFEADALEKMYEKISEDEADICLCDAYKYYTELDKSLCSDEFVKWGVFPEKIPFNKKDIPDKIFNLGANVPWNKMLRRDFLKEKGLLFQNIRKANDTYFILMALFLADKITAVRERLVHYRTDSEESITSSAVEIPPCAFEAYSLLKSELEKREDYTEENKRSLINRTARGMLRILHLPMKGEDYERVREFLINTGLETLDIRCEGELYDSPWVYEDIKSLFSNSSTEHLIYKFNSGRVSRDKLKSRSIKDREKLEKTKIKYEKKLAEGKQQLKETKAQLKQTEASLKKMEKKYESLDKSFTDLRKKWYVRLFVKIENILGIRKKPSK